MTGGAKRTPALALSDKVVKLIQKELTRGQEINLPKGASFPQKVKALRGSLTLIEFAKMLGISQLAVVKYERGAAMPSARNAIKLASYAGVTVAELLK